MTQPRYLEIANHLRAIVAGSNSGDALLSDAELCARFDVSRMTARQAVQLLVNEGLVIREPGKGTFVGPRHTARPLWTALSFTVRMRERGLAIDSELIASEETEVTPEEAETLGLEPGDSTTFVTRLRRADGVPLALERAVLHPDVASAGRGLVGSLHEAFEEMGHVPSRARARVTARIATKRERELLQLPNRGVVVCEHWAITDQHGRPLEHTESICSAKGYELETVLERGVGLTSEA